MSAPAFAGFVATTDLNLGAVSGLTFTVNDTNGNQSGTFASFTPDTANDIQITGSDLDHYRYNISMTAASTASPVSITGTYEIYYDSNLNGVLDTGDYSISPGNISATAPVFTLPMIITGSLTQLTPPDNSAFGDLSYGGNDVIFFGTYGDNGANFQATFTQNA